MKKYPGIKGLSYTETPAGTHYKTGPFHFQVDGDSLLITRDTETSHQSVAVYHYKSHDRAEDAAWNIARQQIRA